MWTGDHAAGADIAVFFSFILLLINCHSSTSSPVSRSRRDASADSRNDTFLEILTRSDFNPQHSPQSHKDQPRSSQGEHFSLNGASKFVSQGFFTRLKKRSRNPRSLNHLSSGCPVARDGLPLIRCPSTRTHQVRQRHNVVCIDDTALCDGRRDCPGHEDEDKAMCLFYRAINKHLDILFMAVRRQPT